MYKSGRCYMPVINILVFFVLLCCDARPARLPDNVAFVSFGGGHNPVHIANQELQKRTNKQFIPRLTGEFFENDKTIGQDYYERLSPVLRTSNRGFHYWSWKPYVVLKTMQRMPLGTIVIYLDAGAYLTRNIYSLIAAAERHGRVFFDNYHDNASYCKCEPVYTLIKKEANRQEFFKTPQLDASFFLISNTLENRRFVQKWLDLCLDYSYVSDQKSKCCDESVSFIEHRHDQALLTLLAYLDPTGQKRLPNNKKHRFIHHHRRRSL